MRSSSIGGADPFHAYTESARGFIESGDLTGAHLTRELRIALRDGTEERRQEVLKRYRKHFRLAPWDPVPTA